jgi:hypothetical protein
MIEILGILGGAVARLVTWGTDYYTKKQENSHELVLLETQLKLEASRTVYKQLEIALQSEANIDEQWAKALVSTASSSVATTGDRFIDRLNASVRPVIAYWWCLVLYSVSKGFLIYAAFQDKLPIREIANVVVSDFDMAVIGSIMGFFFLDRAIRKASGK